MALNVASVRPAIGRVNTRSTNAAKSGTRGGSRGRSNARPGPDGSIRHVTSIPSVAPARWTNRRRRVGGSFHVRDRQATGNPSPSTPIERPAGDEVDDREPSARRSSARDRA